MKTGIYYVSVWAGCALILYFGADLIAKGQTLNALTPFPILGYVLWGIIALALWILLIRPILSFVAFSCRSCHSPMEEAKMLARSLKEHYEDRHNPDPDTIDDEVYRQAHEFYVDLDCAIKQRNMKAISTLLEEGQRFDRRAEDCRKLIHAHCQAAGIAVVFSNNALWDGACILFIQLRLVLELCRRFGYRTSPVFNTCILFWVIGNSIAAAILNNALQTVSGQLPGAAANSDELLLDNAIGETVADIGTCVNALNQLTFGFGSHIIKLALEAISAGSLVYITGQIVLKKLARGHSAKPSGKDLLNLRREGRMMMAKSILPVIKEKIKKILSKESSDPSDNKLGEDAKVEPQ